jgi:diadenosine tetraphosphate (Ap4A) HIT family hydrolase
MAGLDPAIHVLLLPIQRKIDVDARHPSPPRLRRGFPVSARRSFSGGGKAGHDEGTSMPSDASAWSLHSQLKKDTIDIGDLPLCKVLVIKDAHYPWLLLVPRREGAVEIIDLDEVAQAQLMTEISRVSRALKEVAKCDKLNVAALGNLVPQLHVHVIARRTSDAAWPRPVWGVMPPLAHDAEEVQNFINALRRKIWLG